MSIKAVGMILEHSPKSLKPSEVLVLIAIANHVDDKGISFPSMDKIARNSHVSKRQVIRILSQLQDKGEIKIKQRKRQDDLHDTNLYTLNEKYWHPNGGSDKLTPPHSDKLSLGSDTDDTRVVSPMSPKPSIEPSITKNPPLSPQVEIPSNLNTPEFNKVWLTWQAHRREIKKKLTPRSMKMQLKDLGKYPVGVAIQMVEQSIRGGYQGIFPVKQSQNGQHAPQKRVRVETDVVRY